MFRMKPIETKYKGCRFRSRLEARWAVFFDALGIKWRYEPEGFIMRFDYKAFAAEWKKEPFKEVIPPLPTFKQLHGKEYRYLPDFYLPELDYWIEIKGRNPTIEEIGKAFMLDQMLAAKASLKEDTAKTKAELETALTEWFNQSVFILYDDIPSPYPLKGNIFGYRERWTYPNRMGEINLCWQQCPLCSGIGISKIGESYCDSCYDRLESLLLEPLVKDWGIGGSPAMELVLAGEQLDEMDEVQEVYEVIKRLINPEFFASGHKGPKLQEAYEAARSARFEHKGFSHPPR